MDGTVDNNASEHKWPQPSRRHASRSRILQGGPVTVNIETSIGHSNAISNVTTEEERADAIAMPPPSLPKELSLNRDGRTISALKRGRGSWQRRKAGSCKVKAQLKDAVLKRVELQRQRDAELAAENGVEGAPPIIRPIEAEENTTCQEPGLNVVVSNTGSWGALSTSTQRFFHDTIKGAADLALLEAESGLVNLSGDVETTGAHIRELSDRICGVLQAIRAPVVAVPGAMGVSSVAGQKKNGDERNSIIRGEVRDMCLMAQNMNNLLATAIEGMEREHSSLISCQKSLRSSFVYHRKHDLFKTGQKEKTAKEEVAQLDLISRIKNFASGEWAELFINSIAENKKKIVESSGLALQHDAVLSRLNSYDESVNDGIDLEPLSTK